MALLKKLDAKEPVTVLITGAAGQIAYNLVFLVARGDLLGPDQPIRLHLLDIPPMEAKLGAVVMELEDIASPVLRGVVATSDYEKAFTGVDIAMLVGARPRGPGMERKDLLAANASIFKGQGEALGKHASPDVKVLVVGNPANTNALIASTYAPNIPKANFTALTRLDQNRATSAIAKRLGVTDVSKVDNVIIWGNHSTTQYPDVRFATVAGTPRPQDSAGVPALLGDEGKKWAQTEFIAAIQQRGKAVIDARGASSAASAAEASVQHVRDWVLGSKGKVVSMGVYTDGKAYGVTEGLIFSLPLVTERGGAYKVVADLSIDDFSKGKLTATEEELKQEKAMALA